MSRTSQAPASRRGTHLSRATALVGLALAACSGDPPANTEAGHATRSVRFEPGTSGDRWDARDGHVRGLREALGRHHASFGLARPDLIADLALVHAKTAEPGDPARSVAKVQQTFAGLPVIGATLNIETSEGDVQAVHGAVLSRDDLDATFGALARLPRLTFADAARAVGAACGAAARPLERDDRTPWIDRRANTIVYRLSCGATIYHVDATSGEIVGSRSARAHWISTTVPIRTGRDGDRLSNPGTAWMPSDIGKPNTAMTRTSGVKADKSPFASSFCYWQMSKGYDGDSVPPYPSLMPAGDYVRNGIDLCSSPTVFTATSNDKLQEQHAYDRLWLAASRVDLLSDAKFWAAITPDEEQSLRVRSWRADPSGDNCGGFAASYVALTEDIDLCLDHANYQTYLAPLHEFGHYIADSYGFANLDLGPSCEQSGAQEGVATAIAIMLEHHRYTGGGEELTATDRETLFRNGPGQGRAFAAEKSDLVNVDAACSDPYDAAVAIVQVMWKLLNNSICQYDSLGDCASVATIGPTFLPVWIREDFTRTLDTTSDDATVEGFLWALYRRFITTRVTQLSADQLVRFMDVFRQNGVDL